LSIGALLVTGSGSKYTVYAGTGEANTSSDSYAGIGVIASTNGGSSWHRVGGPELNGALIFRLAGRHHRSQRRRTRALQLDTTSSTTWKPVPQPTVAERRQNFNPGRQHDHRSV
jgi:hypothetical protein